MMGLEALSEGYRDLMCHIYSPKVYYQRVISGYPRSDEAELARAKLNPGH